ncbi:MAG: hypothetical protein Kow0090_11100 [Myxococcota bacterium]
MNVILVIVFLGAVIFFHELGHFLIAKYFDVKVLEFALGFGPKLLKKRLGETEYSIRALPLGGLVKMAGEDAAGELKPEDKGRTFLEKPVWQRILIILAGPLANLLLPIPLYFTILAAPQEGPSTLVAYIVPESPSAKAGIRVGDRILAVDGEKVVLFSHLSKIIRSKPNKTVSIKLVRDSQPMEIKVHTEKVTEKDILGKEQTYGRIGIMSSFKRADIGIISEKSIAYRAGLKTWDRIAEINGRKIENWDELQRYFEAGVSGNISITVLRPKEISREGLLAENRVKRIVKITLPDEIEAVKTTEELGFESSELYVAAVEQNLPANTMGLKKGDRILAVDGKKLLDEAMLLDYIAPARERPVTLEWKSGDELKKGELKLQKTEVESIAKVKVPDYPPGFGTYIERYPAEMTRYRENPIIAFKNALLETAGKSALIIAALASMFTGEVPIDQIGGPIMLYKLSSEAAERGLDYFFSIIAFISINLGLINLFPVPILDGGLIAIFLVEAMRRKPIPDTLRYAMNVVGLFLLISLMLFAIKNDIVRYWFS